MPGYFDRSFLVDVNRSCSPAKNTANSLKQEESADNISCSTDEGLTRYFRVKVSIINLEKPRLINGKLVTFVVFSLSLKPRSACASRGFRKSKSTDKLPIIIRVGFGANPADLRQAHLGVSRNEQTQGAKISSYYYCRTAVQIIGHDSC